MSDNQKPTPDNSNSRIGLGIAIGVMGVLAVAGIAGLTIAYTGAYNIAATEKHFSFTRWAFETTFHNSVEQRAAGVSSPEKLTPEMLQAGAAAYKAMCQHCHAGPGVDRSEWASGMRPRPPHLAEAATGWSPQEVFWIAKHGIKMTGMPAFGPTHEDKALWNIVAFVKELPAMTPERYASLGEGESGRHGSGQHGAAARDSNAQQ